MVRKILVVVDDRPSSTAAIRHGIELASAYHASILFFCPVLNMYFQAQLSAKAHGQLAYARELAKRAGVSSQRAMASGLDSSECVAQAAQMHVCDLIVVGTEGRNAFLRWLNGSMLPGLLSLAKVPVLVCQASATHTGLPTLDSSTLQARAWRRSLREQRVREPND